MTGLSGRFDRLDRALAMGWISAHFFFHNKIACLLAATGGDITSGVAGQ